ncbi:MAG TPA: serine hydrolase domain-containing protein, partial [Gemmataceae bacterium]|nr:serine hydrolase domain-containing protein [Gemmataceae bacterium]
MFIVSGIGQFEAEELALKQCNDDPDRKGRDGACFLYAVGDQVVLPQRSFKPLSQRPAGQPQTQQAATTQPRGDNSQPPPTATRAEIPSATEPTSVAVAFDGAMRGWMARYGVSRASVAVMKDNRLIYATGYGGRGANERLDVWSLSKAITALCMSTLVKDHRLRLDDPIGPLLAPLTKKFGPLADERLASATVAQLLSHRSGLPTLVVDNRFAPGLGEVLRRHRPRDATADMLMPSAMKLHLARAPGLNYEYSNVGYLLLGKIIEFLTGQPYETACGDRVLAKAGIKRPALDPDWGHVSHSAGGWSLSGPEYLAFSRLLDAQQSPVLTTETRAFLNSTDGRWINDDKVVAYTLGVLIRPVAGAAANIFHGGAWHWDQRDSRGGPIRENRGTRFVLGGNGIAWFASFDGVSSDTHPNAYRELDDAFWRASRSVSYWPTNDEFAAMGIGPVSSSDAPQPASLNSRTQDAPLR